MDTNYSVVKAWKGAGGGGGGQWGEKVNICILSTIRIKIYNKNIKKLSGITTVLSILFSSWTPEILSWIYCKKMQGLGVKTLLNTVFNTEHTFAIIGWLTLCHVGKDSLTPNWKWAFGMMCHLSESSVAPEMSTYAAFGTPSLFVTPVVNYSWKFWSDKGAKAIDGSLNMNSFCFWWEL